MGVRAVDEDVAQPDALLARAREALGVGADARRDRLDLVASGYLQPVGAVIVVDHWFKEFVQIADDVVAGCHPTASFAFVRRSNERYGSAPLTRRAGRADAPNVFEE